jgi:hypothetical protein
MNSTSVDVYNIYQSLIRRYKVLIYFLSLFSTYGNNICSLHASRTMIIVAEPVENEDVYCRFIQLMIVNSRK